MSNTTKFRKFCGHTKQCKWCSCTWQPVCWFYASPGCRNHFTIPPIGVLSRSERCQLTLRNLLWWFSCDFALQRDPSPSGNDDIALKVFCSSSPVLLRAPPSFFWSSRGQSCRHNCLCCFLTCNFELVDIFSYGRVQFFNPHGRWYHEICPKKAHVNMN